MVWINLPRGTELHPLPWSHQSALWEANQWRPSPQGPAAIIGCCLQSNNIHSVQPCISFKNCLKLVIVVPQINCSLSSWLFPPFGSLLLSSRSDIIVFVLLWGGKPFCLFFFLNTQLLLIRAGGWCWESNLPHLWLDKKQVNTLTLKGTSESPVRL